MTFSNIPGPIDGALISGSLFRKGIFAAIKGDGVIGSADLKVSASSPAGQSLRIAPGTAAILNGYQTTPNELYVASNPTLHNVTSGDMPGSSGGATYWMVALVVGDPQTGYSQAGHPFMPSDFDEAQANTFQYIRPVILPCSSSNTKFSDLGKTYPGLALARLAIPASTTTITDAMITDLRVQAGDASTRRWNAACTSNVSLTNAQAQTDVPGATITIAVGGVNEVFDVDINTDVFITGGVANFTDLAVDGGGQGGSIIAQLAAHNSGHGMWTITGLTPGNHIFKVVSSNFTGSTGTALHSAGATKIRVRRIA